jgi:O-antigen/teichoic acid export membrane protein
MTLSEVKRNIWRNTLSNYAALIIRTIVGLLMFRMLYQGLPKEAFGFWMLLWSVFGYGILLDFGFGLTAQKRVAELSVHQDWDQLSRVLSTIFFVYCAIALTMILVVLSASHFLIGLFEVSPENRELFREILIYFFCGMGIAFPLGIFTEILRGQQRIRVNNFIAIGTQIVNFALLATALHYQWGLKSIFLIALSTAIGQYLIAAFVAMQPMKSVRIRPGYFSWQMVRHTTQFSFYAYFVMVGYMIMTKTDQLVIGSVMAVWWSLRIRLASWSLRE